MMSPSEKYRRLPTFAGVNQKPLRGHLSPATTRPRECAMFSTGDQIISSKPSAPLAATTRRFPGVSSSIDWTLLPLQTALPNRPPVIRAVERSTPRKSAPRISQSFKVADAKLLSFNSAPVNSDLMCSEKSKRALCRLHDEKSEFVELSQRKSLPRNCDPGKHILSKVHRWKFDAEISDSFAEMTINREPEKFT